ncbi:hypothetical protein VTI74DRAFT_7200 [Chaetomium olivicolor]
MSSTKQRSRINTWGYTFEWTADHQSAEELRHLIFSYDELATQCLDRFDDIRSLPLRNKIKSKSDGKESDDVCPHPDFYELLRDRAPEDELLQQLWDEVTTIPSWVDWDQIARGQKVFYRYAGPSIVGLTFVSLLGGMGSSRVVETLTRTGGFGVHVARHRLLETFQHVLEVTHSPASLRPGGKGFASSIRVRFLHASVRRRILSLARSNPSYYPLSAHGIPINDLDSLATILAFSAALVWIAFPRQGIFLRSHEAEDYLALWRYVAHLLGCPTTPYLSTPRSTKALMESLLLSELSPSPTSQLLANNLILALRAGSTVAPSPTRWR